MIGGGGVKSVVKWYSIVLHPPLSFLLHYFPLLLFISEGCYLFNHFLHKWLKVPLCLNLIKGTIKERGIECVTTRKKNIQTVFLKSRIHTPIIPGEIYYCLATSVILSANTKWPSLFQCGEVFVCTKGDEGTEKEHLCRDFQNLKQETAA